MRYPRGLRERGGGGGGGGQRCCPSAEAPRERPGLALERLRSAPWSAVGGLLSAVVIGLLDVRMLLYAHPPRPLWAIPPQLLGSAVGTDLKAFGTD